MNQRLAVSALALLGTLLACGRSEFLEPRRHGPGDASGADVDGGPMPGPDAGADAGKPTPPDAGRRPDGGPQPWDAGTCYETLPAKLVPRPIVSARVAAEEFASPRIGSGVALEVEVQLLSGCEELAKVDLVLLPGNATDFVTLKAFAWVQQDGACEPVAPLVKTAAFLPGRGFGNLRVVVSDGHVPGGVMLLSFEVGDCPAANCWCSVWDPPGTGQEFQACDTDCDCVDGFSCLPTLAPGGTTWSCLRPCTKQTDCPQSGCGLDGAHAPWVCGSLDACPVPEDCPAGFSCVLRDSPSFCEDRRSAPTSAPCRCDAECPSGQRCIVGWRETPTCEIPCADHQDCPFDWLTCGTSGFCVPLED